MPRAAIRWSAQEAPMKKTVAFAVVAMLAGPAFAQEPAPPAAPPWQQGRPAALATSTLHPFAPHLTGRPAAELPGDKGTVFVGNRNAKNVYAVIDRDGKREVKTLLKGLDTPNGIVFNKGTLFV